MASYPHSLTQQSFEQRLYDLLQPFRNDCYSGAAALPISERKCLVLCENIAFIIRHNQSIFGKPTQANDISVVSRNWSLMMAGGTKVAGFGNFANGSGYTHNVVRVHVGKGEGEEVVDRLTGHVNKTLETFFPEL